MSKDVVQRLRSYVAAYIVTDSSPHAADCREAAEEIERLRGALKPFADLGGKLDGAPNLIGLLTEADFQRARDALAG